MVRTLSATTVSMIMVGMGKAEVEDVGIGEGEGDVYDVALGIHRNPEEESSGPRAPRGEHEPAPDEPEPA